MSKPDEDLTFEEYWERYSCATDTPKQAARAAWLLAIKQERRLQLLRPTPRTLDGACTCGLSNDSFHPNTWHKKGCPMRQPRQ